MRKLLTLTVLAVAMILCTGCQKRSSESAQEVKARYAALFAKGFPFGLSGTITAAGYDPVTYDLIDVSIETEDESLIHAKRAQIIINPEKDTMMLRLEGVVGADLELGHIFEMDGFSTAEFALGIDVRP